MRPFDDDDMPVGSDEYSDVALMMAAVREWPSEEFARDLDARVARRFAPLPPAPAERGRETSRGRRWLSLPALGGVGGLVVAAVVAVVVVTQSGGGTPDAFNGPAPFTSQKLRRGLVGAVQPRRGQRLRTAKASTSSTGLQERAGSSEARATPGGHQLQRVVLELGSPRRSRARTPAPAPSRSNPPRSA